MRCDRLAVDGQNKMTKHAVVHDAEGMAALAICESLLLALTDLKIISEQEARDLLTDVATTHDEAATTSPLPNKHHVVAEIVRRILAAKNGVRHRPPHACPALSNK